MQMHHDCIISASFPHLFSIIFSHKCADLSERFGIFIIKKEQQFRLLPRILSFVSYDARACTCRGRLQTAPAGTSSTTIRQFPKFPYLRNSPNTCRQSCTSIGFAICAFIPHPRQSCTSSESASAVIAIIGRSLSARSKALIPFVAS